MDWLGKVGVIATTLLVYACLPKPIKKESGLFNLPRPPKWNSAIVMSAALLTLFGLVAYFQPDDNLLTFEIALFQGNMLGLDEDMSFRGVLLAILIAAFAKPWCVLGIQIG
jgi:hypothetical protein